MNWTGCELVEPIPGDHVVRDSRVPADRIVESYESGQSIDEIAHTFAIPQNDLRKLFSFAAAHNLLDRTFIDWTRCDLVEVVPGKVSGKPIVKNSRVMADQVVESYELGQSVEAIAYSFSLDPEQIRALLDFAGFRSAMKTPA